MNPNQFALRVWGDFACYTRPEMKVERVSYPVPTPSAARGILEAIFWEPQMRYLIDHLLIVKKGRWFSFRRNEVQKVINLREAQTWMKKPSEVSFIEAGGGAADAAQRSMLALAEVEFVIVADIRLTKKAQPPADNLGKYLDLMRHRAARGKCFHRPCLGCREFAADFDLVEDLATIQPLNYSDELGLMLYDVFDPLDRGGLVEAPPRPTFFEANVTNGRLECHPDRVKIIRPGVGGI